MIGSRFIASYVVATVLSVTGACSVYAATEVSGTLSTTTWTEAESPYRVTGELDVPADVTLTIEPGVVVSFDPEISMQVDGTLNAVGTIEKPIKFKGESEAVRWGGVVIRESAASCNLEHFEMTGASLANVDGRFYPGAFNIVDGAKASLQHGWFHDFSGPGIESNSGSELVMLDCLVEESKEGIHSANSYAYLERVRVRDVWGYSDSIDFDFDSTPRSVIRDCTIENNEEDDGIDIASASPIIENVVVSGVKAGKAFSIDGNCTPRITGVVIFDCQQGLVCKDSCTPIFRHITITRCKKAIDCYEKIGGRGGGHGSGDSMILWDNETPVALDSKSTFEMTYSLVAGGYEGKGNIDVDPLFLNPDENDFHVRPESPAIGAGKHDEDMGAYYTPKPPWELFVRADANHDGTVDVSDASKILLVLFSEQLPTTCLDAFDADDTGVVNITDAIYLLQFLFSFGEIPPTPYPDAGEDPTPDSLDNDSPPCKH